jgi:hypothetical protein
MPTLTAHPFQASRGEVCHWKQFFAVWQCLTSKNAWQGSASSKCKDQTMPLLKWVCALYSCSSGTEPPRLRQSDNLRFAPPEMRSEGPYDEARCPLIEIALLARIICQLALLARLWLQKPAFTGLQALLIERKSDKVMAPGAARN